MRLHISQVFWNRQRLAIAAMLLVWGNPAVVFADQASDVAALEAKCEAEREAKIKRIKTMIPDIASDSGKTMAIRGAASLAERSQECSGTCQSASRHSKPAKR
jgi:hypothetical protein